MGERPPPLKSPAPLDGLSGARTRPPRLDSSAIPPSLDGPAVPPRRSSRHTVSSRGGSSSLTSLPEWISFIPSRSVHRDGRKRVRPQRGSAPAEGSASGEAEEVIVCRSQVRMPKSRSPPGGTPALDRRGRRGWTGEPGGNGEGEVRRHFSSPLRRLRSGGTGFGLCRAGQNEGVAGGGTPGTVSSHRCVSIAYILSRSSGKRSQDRRSLTPLTSLYICISYPFIVTIFH